MLLGAPAPELGVSDLIVAASVFGISAGATRTSLWRMVANGELSMSNATYALDGGLLERRDSVEDAARPAHTLSTPWERTWDLAVVSAGRRPATERLELRKAAAALHLAEIREGVWTRPDNLDPQRLRRSRAVLDQQCLHYRHATTNINIESITTLFQLGPWAHDARRLTDAMTNELDPTLGDATDTLAYLFTLSITVVRHLQLDPQLPAELLPNDWPAAVLRNTYRHYDAAFKRRLNHAMAPSERLASTPQT